MLQLVAQRLGDGGPSVHNTRPRARFGCARHQCATQRGTVAYSSAVLILCTVCSVRTMLACGEQCAISSSHSYDKQHNWQRCTRVCVIGGLAMSWGHNINIIIMDRMSLWGSLETTLEDCCRLRMLGAWHVAVGRGQRRTMSLEYTARLRFG